MRYFQTKFEYRRPDEPNRKRYFVAGGTTLGFDWFVANQGGSHPCAYVILPKRHAFNGTPYYDIPVECHGGLTYGADGLQGVKLKDGEYVIGWDYAHWGDYIPAYGASTDHKKWTTDEIVNEVVNVCKQLFELNIKEIK